jgi:hypothetical protein
MLSEIDDSEGCLQWIMFVVAVFLITGCISHTNAEFGDHNDQIYSLGTPKVLWCGLWTAA